jgi:hypothetical protein
MRVRGATPFLRASLIVHPTNLAAALSMCSFPHLIYVEALDRVIALADPLICALQKVGVTDDDDTRAKFFL